MKLLLAGSLLLAGCTLLDKDIEHGFVYDTTITEENYKKVPCLVDGQVVKKKKKR